MVQTKKFSEFATANLATSDNMMVGTGGGLNIKAAKVVTWTTDTRPAPPFNGLFGYNTSLSQYEFYNSSTGEWEQLESSGDIASIYARLASHTLGDGASLIGLQNHGITVVDKNVQNLADAAFIVKTNNGSMLNAQALDDLTSGVLKSDSDTGEVSISAPLTSIDALTTNADEMLYTTSSNVYATTPLTSFSRIFLQSMTQQDGRIVLDAAQAGDNTDITSLTGLTGLISFPSAIGMASGGLITTNTTLADSYTLSAYDTLNLTTVNFATLTAGNPPTMNLADTVTKSGGYIYRAGGTDVPLTDGGTNASLTAVNGGVVYSTATAMAISAAGSAGQFLTSAGAAAPVWTTATFPSTAGTSGSILISNGTNIINSTSLWPNTVGSSGTLLRSNGTSNAYTTATFADTYSANTVLAATTSNTVAGLASSANTVLLANAAGIISFAALSSPAIVSYANPNGSNSTGNGTFNYQYADPFAASNNNTGTATIPRMVYANIGNYSTTSFSIKPNVWLVGPINAIGNTTSGNVWNVNNPITLDSSFSSAASGTGNYVKGIKFSSTTYFNLNYSTASAPNDSDMIFEDSAMLAVNITGGASRIPNLYFLDSEDLGSGLLITQANAIIEKSKVTSISVVGTAAAGATTFTMRNSSVTGDVSLQGAASAAITGNIRQTSIAGALTLLSTNVTATVDPASYPGAGIVFSSGALQSQVTIPGVTPVAQNSSSNLTAWNLATAPNAKQTMTENTTLSNPTNQIEGQFYTFTFTQSATPRTLAFDTGYDNGGVTPVISTVNGSENIFVYRSNGTRMKLVGLTLGV